VNTDASGLLYLSDYLVNEVWRVEATGFYTVYQGVDSATDAKTDAAGDIWWTNGAVTFGRISVPENTLTTWEVGVDHNLGGLAFDDLGRVWLTEWFGYGSNLYRFDPATTELCTYTISLGSYSYYTLYDNGTLWLGHWGLGRIYRVNPAGSATYWQITGAEPVGLALDGEGNLWWADEGLAALGRLNPTTNEVTLFALPVGTAPQMVAVNGNEVWYTESGAGTVGELDPASAAGTTTTVAPKSTPVTHVCAGAAAGATSSVSTRGGSLDWAPGTATPATAPAGWQIYELSASADPYGIATTGGYLWVSDKGNRKLLRAFRAVPGIALEKRTNGEDADTPPGPRFDVGQPVTWTYIVENIGNVDLTGVTVVDDNGTPANPADDYTCPIGDLAAGEVDELTCSQVGTAQNGQYMNLATVMGQYDGGEVSDDDPSHYFGSSARYVFLPLVCRNLTP
jgi:streptogramin lyase